jgi:glycosyltransferase involved in cell wall biosynthesis
MTTDGSAPLRPRTYLEALDQRLEQAAAVLLDVLPRTTDTSPGAVAAALLPALVEHCVPASRTDARWLLLTAAFGAFPTTDELKDFGRRLELLPIHRAQSELLAEVLRDPARGRADLPMTVVSGTAVVDVDFSARHDTHTGIHRVVRETVPRWHANRSLHAVAWIDQFSAFRTLSPREAARVFSFADETAVAPEAEGTADGGGGTATGDAAGPRLVVPWRSVVVLADVVHRHTNARLAALARFSGNTLSLIGYDFIPITSAETRPPVDSIAFAQYLTVVKHAHRVAGISRSATAEFSGFAHAVTAQGLRGPAVRTVELVSQAPSAVAGDRPADRTRPVVLCPGSREPHKNQRAILHAAERLWRDGLDFELRLVGGAGWSDEVLRPAAERLHAAGRPLTELGRVSDDELTEQLRGADFVVFASLHEGYGLPVAEALACGTPVITSNFGSQREIAERGGCVLVDPRDDDDLTAAIRRLLTSPDELARLRQEIACRPERTWDQYAEELWAFLVDGEEGR